MPLHDVAGTCTGKLTVLILLAHREMLRRLAVGSEPKRLAMSQCAGDRRLLADGDKGYFADKVRGHP
jgi:hypothetical protein